MVSYFQKLCISGRIQKLHSNLKMSEERCINLVSYKECKVLVCLSVDVEDREKKAK